MALLSSKQAGLKKKKEGEDSSAVGAQIDFLGIAGFAVTMTSFLAAIQLWDQHQLRPAAVFLAVAVAAGLAFLLVEAYWAKRPLIPLPLLKTSSAVFFALQALLAFGRQAVCLPRPRCIPHPRLTPSRVVLTCPFVILGNRVSGPAQTLRPRNRALVGHAAM